MENGKSETGGVSIFPNFRCGSFTEWTIEMKKVVKTNPVQVLATKNETTSLITILVIPVRFVLVQ